MVLSPYMFYIHQTLYHMPDDELHVTQCGLQSFLLILKIAETSHSADGLRFSALFGQSYFVLLGKYVITPSDSIQLIWSRISSGDQKDHDKVSIQEKKYFFYWFCLFRS